MSLRVVHLPDASGAAVIEIRRDSDGALVALLRAQLDGFREHDGAESYGVRLEWPEFDRGNGLQAIARHAWLRPPARPAPPPS